MNLDRYALGLDQVHSTIVLCIDKRKQAAARRASGCKVGQPLLLGYSKMQMQANAHEYRQLLTGWKPEKYKNMIYKLNDKMVKSKSILRPNDVL